MRYFMTLMERFAISATLFGKAKTLLIVGMIAFIGLLLWSTQDEPLPENQYDPTSLKSIEVVAAGVPKYLGETRNYPRIFRELRDGGFTAYMPFSQFQELPEVKSLSNDIDFFLPCDSDAPQWRAMRQYGIRLVVPGHLIYHEYFVDLAGDRDPLAELVSCVGRENILGVTNYDEPSGPIWDGSLTLDDVRSLYGKIKSVDPTLPVLMVHAPFFASVPVEGLAELYPTEKERSKYFGLVEQTSTFADIVGFDVYPIPLGIGGGITSPSLQGESIKNHTDVFRDYLEWIRREVPNKTYLVTLQGFDFRMQYEPAYLMSAMKAEDIRDLRAPTREELQDMADGSLQSGARVIVWWGQTHITAKDAWLWENIRAVTAAITAR